MPNVSKKRLASNAFSKPGRVLGSGAEVPGVSQRDKRAEDRMALKARRLLIYDYGHWLTVTKEENPDEGDDTFKPQIELDDDDESDGHEPRQTRKRKRARGLGADVKEGKREQVLARKQPNNGRLIMRDRGQAEELNSAGKGSDTVRRTREDQAQRKVSGGDMNSKGQNEVVVNDDHDPEEVNAELGVDNGECKRVGVAEEIVKSLLGDM